MDLINYLKNMGFTEAEAKVYTTFLKYGKSTGYEISKFSGVPRSKIYNHIEVLVSKGILEFSNDGKTNFYKPISPEDLVKLTKKNMDDNLKNFKYLASNMPRHEETDGIWEIEDYNRVLLKAMEIIKNAENSLYIQIWIDELDEQMTDLINEKILELDKSVIILYDEKQKYNTNLKKFYPHGFEMENLEDMKHRWITIVSDEENLLYSGVLFNDEVSGIYTKNKILSFFAKKYVEHDAYCLKLIDKFRDELVEEYGEDLKEIRDIYN